jgi:hypothetical protein
VLVDAVPFFQTYQPAELPRRRNRGCLGHSRVSTQATGSAATAPMDESLDEQKPSGGGGGGGSDGDGGGDGDGDEQQDGDDGDGDDDDSDDDAPVEIDMRQESFGGDCRLWLVPVATSYLFGDLVPPERKGHIAESAPLLEVSREVTIACTARFVGRDILCHALTHTQRRRRPRSRYETSGGGQRSSPTEGGGGGDDEDEGKTPVLCRLAFVPEDSVHEHLSAAHREIASSSRGQRSGPTGGGGGQRSSHARGAKHRLVYARLALQPDQRWRLHEILDADPDTIAAVAHLGADSLDVAPRSRAASAISDEERAASTVDEVARRTEWVSRAEYEAFLRTADDADGERRC